MKNIAAWVIDQAPIATAERGTPVSRIVQHRITTLPNIPRTNCRRPLPQTAVNKAKPTSPAQTSGRKPTFGSQTSTPNPTL
jgi:hypothetical protein